MKKFKAILLIFSSFTLLTVIGSAQTPAFAELVPEVLNSYPHDDEAFTQGLIYFEGDLYESTGLRGRSSLRQVDIETGEPLRLLPVARTEEALAADPSLTQYFAEGLERVGDRLYQLTWQEGEALVYDLATFEQVDTFEYEGEGWGLCYDDRYFIMSAGSQYLHLPDVETFELVVSYMVTVGGSPIAPNLLNELECVGDYVYANLWQTDFIVQIDKFDGSVVAAIDASSLLTEEERAGLVAGSDVLNGIAYNPDNDSFYITGKNWPKLFEVRFVPAG